MAPSFKGLLRKKTSKGKKEDETNSSALQRANFDDDDSVAGPPRVAHLRTGYADLPDDTPDEVPPQQPARRYVVDRYGQKHELFTPLELAAQGDRVPLSKFATVPQPILPNTSHITERDPNSTRHFRTKSLDYHNSRGSSRPRDTSHPRGNSRPRDTSRSTVDRVQAQGCNFEMMVTDTDTNISTPPSSEPPEMGPNLRRSSRSSSRGRERLDSHQQDVDNVSSQDFATKPRTDGLQVPALNIRKTTDKTTRIPSPRSSPRSPAEDLPVPPQTAENLRKIPAKIIPPEEQYTHLPRNWKLVDPPAPKQSIASKAAKTLGFQSSGNSARVSPAAPATNKPLPPVVTPFVPKQSPAVVRPPVYDPTKPAGLQWTSPGITNSRPFQPWEPSPRWSCCKCGAETIVEQTVCANLSCMHDRCPVRCQVTVRHHKGFSG